MMRLLLSMTLHQPTGCSHTEILLTVAMSTKHTIESYQLHSGG